MDDNILAKLKVLMGDGEPLSDDLLKIYISQGVEEALSYCNLSELPTEAETVVAMMVFNQLSSQLGGSVKSLSEGDRSVSLNTLSAIDLDTKTKKALDRFKKARCI